jgi:two-component system response regulator AdeR
MAHILVVDDEEEMRTMIGTYLARAGHVITQAADGREAMQYVRAKRPDLVVTDIRMPEWDGIQLMMALTHEGIRVPVIAMTGVPPDTVPYLRIARGLGAVRVLAKPFTMPKFMQQVSEVLG